MVLSHKGLFWGIMSAVGVVLYTLIPRSLLEKWERDVVVGLGMLIGGIAINLYAPCWAGNVSLPLKGWLCIAVIVILGTVLSFSLVTLGITVIGPIRTSMLNAVEPVTATILSVLWLGTSFTVTDLIAFAAILTTVVLLAKSEN
jgi:drug/metabolite transporter (DMT)-like permease